MPPIPGDPFGWTGATIDGRFAVESVAGEGAFGIVYRGRHLALGEPIAIKCLKLPAALDRDERAQFLASFQDEARLMHRLSRRTAAIVQALDVGAATSPLGAWTPYIVMEWLEGETLQAELDRRRAFGEPPRTMAAAIDLLEPAADALSVAHAENVSHRDVKPGNLFLTRAGAATTLKVVDFGIAKVLDGAPTLAEALRRTGASIQALTPQYGAPEQFDRRFGATGPWTDVFALALIVVELVSGQPALSGRTAFELFASAIAEARPTPATRGVAVSAAFEAVLARALEVDPARRYPTVGAFWAALGAARAESADATLLAPSGSGLARAPADAPPRAAAPLVRAVETAAAGAPRTNDAERASASGEHRVCTVVVVDLGEFEALTDRLDPERAAELVDECQAIVTREVDALGGTMCRTLGASAMAVFGAQRTTDNDPERAVAAALAIESAIGRVAHRVLRRQRPTVTIALETGRVFAGRIGGTTRRGFAVLGDAANVASRLAPLAPRGAIVVGRETHRQVAGVFRFEPIAIGDAGIVAHRVIGRAPAGGAALPSDFFGVDTRFVGRSAEMARLLDLFEASATEPMSHTVTSEQRAQIVTLVGPAGVGRSRILGELARELDGRARVAIAQASALSETVSYALVASLVRAMFHVNEDDVAADVERKLRRGLRELARAPRAADEPELDRALTAIASLVAAPSQSSTASSEALTPNDQSEVAKHRIAAAFARLMAVASASQPLALLCDDGQWADEASLDLIDELVVRLADAPVFVVLSTRPSLYERRPHWGEGKPSHVRLDVGSLTRRHVEEIVRDRLRHVDQLPTRVVRALADRAEGNPLTLHELLYLLVDARVIELREPGPWLVHEERLQALALPTTIQGMVQARLDRLDPDERGVLAAASVIGRTFWAGAVRRLLAASSETEVNATELLAKLRDKQLVRAREASAFPDDIEYVFAEAATQEVAYATLIARARELLHREVADWLERVAPGDGAAAMIALHWDQGGEIPRALAAYTRAASHAASLGQNSEALRLLERARDLQDETSGTGGEAADVPGEVDDARVATWRERTGLRLEIGDMLRRLGRLDEALAAYEAARAAVLRIERRDGQPLGAAEPLKWDARVDYRLALTHKVRGGTAEPRELVERAIARATDAGAVDETAAMWALLAALHRRSGDLDACLASARRGLSVVRAARKRESAPGSLLPPSSRDDERRAHAVSDLLVGLGAVFQTRGELVRAERCYRQAARVAEAKDSAHAARFALTNLAVTRCLRGDDAGAREVFQRVLAINERVGDLFDLAVAHNNLAEIENRLGAPARALEHARKSVQLGEQVRAEAELADFYRNLAEASVALGDVTAALEAGTKALAHAERGGGRVYLRDALVALARICAKASGSTGGDAVVQAAASRLRDALAREAEDPALADAARECRELLAGG